MSGVTFTTRESAVAPNFLINPGAAGRRPGLPFSYSSPKIVGLYRFGNPGFCSRNNESNYVRVGVLLASYRIQQATADFVSTAWE